MLFYLVTYTFTTLGAFGVVAWIGNRKDERLFVDDWAGVGAGRPGVALAMTIFLLSLGGVPPTGGFFGKFYLFRAAMESPQLYWLVVLGVLNSVVSIYYYLRIIVAMYFRDPMRPLAPTDGATMRAGLLLTAIAVVLLGIFPSTFVDWAGPIAAQVVLRRLPSLRARRVGARTRGAHCASTRPRAGALAGRCVPGGARKQAAARGGPSRGFRRRALAAVGALGTLWAPALLSRGLEPRRPRATCSRPHRWRSAAHARAAPTKAHDARLRAQRSLLD